MLIELNGVCVCVCVCVCRSCGGCGHAGDGLPGRSERQMPSSTVQVLPHPCDATTSIADGDHPPLCSCCTTSRHLHFTPFSISFLKKKNKKKKQKKKNIQTYIHTYIIYIYTVKYRHQMTIFIEKSCNLIYRSIYILNECIYIIIYKYINHVG